MSAEGLISRASGFAPAETMNRLEAAVKAKGMTVFARIDHAAGAAAAGLALRPTELLIFGDARAGTPLMQAAQTIAIDLPLKALVWQDAAGGTWLSYNEPAWLARRHGAATEPAIRAMTAALEAVVAAATATTPPPFSGHTDQLLDEALEESFPASDAPAISIDDE